MQKAQIFLFIFELHVKCSANSYSLIYCGIFELHYVSKKLKTSEEQDNRILLIFLS
jgi:hypothetical protein